MFFGTPCIKKKGVIDVNVEHVKLWVSEVNDVKIGSVKLLKRNGVINIKVELVRIYREEGYLINGWALSNYYI